MATEGWPDLCSAHEFDKKLTNIAWIYDSYAMQIADKLQRSHHLLANCFAEAMAAMVSLSYGGIFAYQDRLTSQLYTSLTCKQRNLTT